MARLIGQKRERVRVRGPNKRNHEGGENRTFCCVPVETIGNLLLFSKGVRRLYSRTPAQRGEVKCLSFEPRLSLSPLSGSK